eukprot:6153914-Amphidinium_carterae.1
MLNCGPWQIVYVCIVVFNLGKWKTMKWFPLSANQLANVWIVEQPLHLTSIPQAMPTKAATRADRPTCI